MPQMLKQVGHAVVQSVTPEVGPGVAQVAPAHNPDGSGSGVCGERNINLLWGQARCSGGTHTHTHIRRHTQAYAHSSSSSDVDDLCSDVYGTAIILAPQTHHQQQCTHAVVSCVRHLCVERDTRRLVNACEDLTHLSSRSFRCVTSSFLPVRAATASSSRSFPMTYVLMR